MQEGDENHYNSRRGYHVLVLSLANMGKPLYVVNRPGSRPSQEQVSAYFDKVVTVCRRAGFGSFRLRGDTDFSQTGYLDGWLAGGVPFVDNRCFSFITNHFRKSAAVMVLEANRSCFGQHTLGASQWRTV